MREQISICKKAIFALLFLPVVLSGQVNNTNTTDNVTRYYYDDQVVSVQIWYGADKNPDSTKTYYPNGKLNEVFYYDEKGLKDSDCFQYNQEGEKLVTWNFSHGKLVGRTDHKLPFSKDKEESVKKALKLLTEINVKTNYNPTKVNDLYNRGVLSVSLGNITLALEDLKKVEYSIDKDPKNKSVVLADSLEQKKDLFRSKLYDRLAFVYASLEMDSFAIQYYHKAIKSAPDDLRILYNFASLLQRRKIYDLACFYLEKIAAVKPDHAYARWSLAKLYSDTGNYEKAMENVAKAFATEKTIAGRNSAYGGRDLRTIRGLIYHKLGESNKGIADLKAALETDKNNSYAMKNLGIIYLEQHKYKKACELFQKAKELNYALIYDETDLSAWLESACNNTPHENTNTKKPYAFPNPATTVISIKDLNAENFDYEFFNFESVSVLKGKSTDGKIDVSTLSSGFYVLKVTTADSTASFRVIKE
ncbi:T9SS type A sorting domain-containing protein [Flavobacterium sp. WG21]|uniref:T9SS type A sorting domain-containing protein n=1 Tax=Flavobacterium sp. WG21 TaxID=1229487 RepID=UPI000348962B|nr:T9SS type A sorting domain-containing protein [Flavobacterium sp. WG21]